jgi:phospholipid/cholesterol/gamma-HCH transport system substrate-binding protein
MQENQSLAIRVGIFFTIAVVIALGLSLQAGKGIFGQKQYEIVANFRQTFGIEPGTRVALRGVPVGQIRSMDWDAGSYRVRVVLSIDQRYEIPRNSIARIQVSSLLGGNFINIAVPEGFPSEMRYLRQGDEIPTEETASLDEVLTVVRQLGSDSQNLVRSLDENQRAVVAKINAIIEENREYFNQTNRSFASVGPKLEELADRLNTMTESVKAGEGTLGRLYSDPQLYEELKAFSDKANAIADQIASGKGDVGKLIYAEEMTAEAKAIMADLQRAARQIEEAVAENREGFANLVATLSETGPRIEEAIRNFNEVSRKINEGNGTIGKLVNDPALYEDAKKAFNQVGESFESSEEQGVFRSFFGILFGALI